MRNCHCAEMFCAVFLFVNSDDMVCFVDTCSAKSVTGVKQTNCVRAQVSGARK